MRGIPGGQLGPTEFSFFISEELRDKLKLGSGAIIGLIDSIPLSPVPSAPTRFLQRSQLETEERRCRQEVTLLSSLTS